MLYLFITFLSAFLLFQVQPIIAKLILPLFGGGAAIWTACMLFFQAFLLLGYLYAHLLTRYVAKAKQFIVHGAMFLFSLLFLPFHSQLNVNDIVSTTPLLDISLILMATIGLPYFLLSATGPLVQRWLTFIDTNRIPYRIYALSNVGSLLALLSYPFVFEPAFEIKTQLVSWSSGYLILSFAFVAWCFQLFKHTTNNEVSKTENRPISLPLNNKSATFNWLHCLLWLALSVTGVVLLVAVTNAMTQNIPPVPFLWILPLSLYLLSFIVSFSNQGLYVRWYWFLFFALSSFAGIFMFFIGSQFSIVAQIIMYSFILFSSCMICHGELARIKPQVERLTLFYLIMALGGFLGSVLVSIVAPIFLVQYTEFPLALFAVYLLFLLCQLTGDSKLERVGMAKWKYHAQNAAPIILGGISIMLFLNLNQLYQQFNLDSSRNFYGILSVKDVTIHGEKQRQLVDGSTSHGTQSLASSKANQPLSYYRASTGGALALNFNADHVSKDVGIIGLGAGALAAYGKSGDNYYFYELNPDVEVMANKYFSFLANSAANIDVILGDGRVSLNQALTTTGSMQFNVMILDAFSGDSIPSHLLTVEAFELYWQHLASDGILAVHISNSHLGLTPLMRGLAERFNKQAIYIKTLASGNEIHDAEWVIITNNLLFLSNANVIAVQSQWPEGKTIVWTDNYSNLLSVLK